MLTPGSDLTVIDTELGRIGVAICYDIRFPELAGLYAARGCQLLVYPGAVRLEAPTSSSLTLCLPRGTVPVVLRPKISAAPPRLSCPTRAQAPSI